MTVGRNSTSRTLAAVVGVGDELLLGETVDTNGSWLSRELSRVGLSVVRRLVVGDVPQDIRAGVQDSLDRADVVLVTGGLGPTPDDLTLEAVAGLLNMPLELDAGLLEHLRKRFLARGFPQLPKQAEAMARVPKGGRILRNSRGSAPGLALEAGRGRLCVLFPGVPREMKGVFRDEVEPLLRQRFSSRLQPAFHRVIHTTGIPESLLAGEVAKLDLPLGEAVSLAFLPDVRGVRLRLTARGAPGSREVDDVLERFEERLDPVVAPFRYRSESGDLADALGKALRRAGMTLATAESCTGGFIAKRMTDHPGSSLHFLGGVVAYANEVKTGLLGVGERLLEEKGAVSREVAEAMARGIANRLGATAGIGVTGVAGPGGGTDEKPAGTVWVAVSIGAEVFSRREYFSGDREDVRERAAQAAMALLLRTLEGKGL